MPAAGNAPLPVLAMTAREIMEFLRHADVAAAFLAGQAVQVRSEGSEAWKTIKLGVTHDAVNFHSPGREWRIAPKPERARIYRCLTPGLSPVGVVLESQVEVIDRLTNSESFGGWASDWIELQP